MLSSDGPFCDGLFARAPVSFCTHLALVLHWHRFGGRIRWQVCAKSKFLAGFCWYPSMAQHCSSRCCACVCAVPLRDVCATSTTSESPSHHTARDIIPLCVAAVPAFGNVICLSSSSVPKLPVSSFSRPSGRVVRVRFGRVGASPKLSWSHELRRCWVFLAACVLLSYPLRLDTLACLFSPLPSRSWLRDILLPAAMLMPPHSARALQGAWDRDIGLPTGSFFAPLRGSGGDVKSAMGISRHGHKRTQRQDCEAPSWRARGRRHRQWWPSWVYLGSDVACLGPLEPPQEPWWATA